MTMPSWLKLDWLKDFLAKPHIIFAICLVGCVLLFLPSTYLDYFGLTQLRDEYRKWIGLATVLSMAVLLAKAGGFGWSWLQEVRWGRTARAESLTFLETLSPEEQLVLISCLLHNRRTITLDYADSAASSLREKGLLVSASVGKLITGFPHTIPSHVWKHLQGKQDEWLPTDEGELNEIRQIVDRKYRLR